MPDPSGTPPGGEIIPQQLEELEQKLEEGGLPPETSATLVSLFRQSFEYKGPPPPEMFRGWEEVIPGLGDRIMRQTELTVAHSIKMDERAMALAEAESETNQKIARRSQPYAFFLGISGILGGTVLVAMDHVWPGLVVALGTISTLAGNFLFTRLHKTLKNPGDGRSNRNDDPPDEAEGQSRG